MPSRYATKAVLNVLRDFNTKGQVNAVPLSVTRNTGGRQFQRHAASRAGSAQPGYSKTGDWPEAGLGAAHADRTGRRGRPRRQRRQEASSSAHPDSSAASAAGGRPAGHLFAQTAQQPVETNFVAHRRTRVYFPRTSYLTRECPRVPAPAFPADPPLEWTSSSHSSRTRCGPRRAHFQWCGHLRGSSKIAAFARRDVHSCCPLSPGAQHNNDSGGSSARPRPRTTSPPLLAVGPPRSSKGHATSPVGPVVTRQAGSRPRI